MLLVKILTLLAVLNCTVWGRQGLRWETIEQNRILALRSQRDVSANTTIDKVSAVGVGLSKVIFEPYGFTVDSLDYVYGLLRFGIYNLVIDAYWNEALLKFQLCPFVFNNSMSDFENSTTFEMDGLTCQVGLTLDYLLSMIDSYVRQTNTNLAANPLTLIFNIHQINNIGNENTVTYDSLLTGSSNDTLSPLLNTYFSNGLFTPAAWSDMSKSLQVSTSSKDSFPILFSFLFDNRLRVTPMVWNNYLSSNSTYYRLQINETHIFTKQSLGAQFESFTSSMILDQNNTDSRTQGWQFSYDTSETPFNDISIHMLVDRGFLPILNHTLLEIEDISSMFNYSLWSWAPTEPANSSIAQYNNYRAMELTKSSSIEQNRDVAQEAYRCAISSSDGLWTVTNCFSEFPVACRHVSDEFRWLVNTTISSYFDAFEMRCQGDWIFTVPKSATQQQALTQLLVSEGFTVGDGAWIDINSIAVEDCWVSGGPYASCPYQKLTTRRNFVRMITPASVICVLVIIGILLLKLKQVPVQDNRKHWKKLINQYTENEKEGVPS